VRQQTTQEGDPLAQEVDKTRKLAEDPAPGAQDALPTEHPLRIVVAETQTIVRDGLRRLLMLQAGMEVIGVAATAPQVIESALRLRPDVLLLDYQIHGMPTLELLSVLDQAGLKTLVVVFAADIAREEAIAALRLGVRGIVRKDSPVEALVRCLRYVAAGEHWVERQLLADAARTYATPEQTFGLSARELDVVRAIVCGACNKEIAQRLGISDLTVKRHLTNIYEKLGVAGRLELALFALSHNLSDRRKPMLSTAISATFLRRAALA
jgi:DNA-binding NarL/FixJ family response regulator